MFFFYSDVNYLSTTAPPSAAEWCSFLRPLRGREPEGMWNLLSIVREMFRRNDRNSIPLLEIITQQCLETAQVSGCGMAHSLIKLDLLKCGDIKWSSLPLNSLVVFQK